MKAVVGMDSNAKGKAVISGTREFLAFWCVMNRKPLIGPAFLRPSGFVISFY
jgi:hypothetical protein